MTDLEREKLLKIYSIVETFKDCFENEVREKLQSLYMTDNFEDLNTACGLLGELIDTKNVVKLLITKPETRNMLKDAYEACTILDNNVEERAEDLKRALAELKTCYYVILNSTYDSEETTEETFGKIFEVCEYGLQVLNMLKSETEETYKQYYINPCTDETITSRIDQLVDTFNMLRPMPPTNEVQTGDDTNENNA